MLSDPSLDERDDGNSDRAKHTLNNTAWQRAQLTKRQIHQGGRVDNHALKTELRIWFSPAA